MATKTTLIAMAIVAVFAAGTMGMVIVAENGGDVWKMTSDGTEELTSDGTEELAGKESYVNESRGDTVATEGPTVIPKHGKFIRKSLLASPDINFRKLPADPYKCFEFSCITAADWCLTNHGCGKCEEINYKCSLNYEDY